jgi:hypothetical protein
MSDIDIEEGRKELCRLEKVIHDEVIKQGVETREASGRFKAGVPSVRKGINTTAEGARIIRIMCQGLLDEAYQIMKDMLRKPDMEDRDRLALIKIIFERAGGRPIQALRIEDDRTKTVREMTGEEMQQMYLAMRSIIEGRVNKK